MQRRSTRNDYYSQDYETRLLGQRLFGQRTTVGGKRRKRRAGTLGTCPRVSLGIRSSTPDLIRSERLRRSSLSRCRSGSGCEDAWCAPARGRRRTLVCQGPTPCRCLTEHVLFSPSLCLLEQLRGQPYCEGNERHKTYDPHRQFHFRQPPDVDHRGQRCRPNPGD